MALFGGTTPKRRPVAEIVSGLTTMVSDLEEARGLAEGEQGDVERQIEELNAQRTVLMREQASADAITGNLRELLGLDLDGDGEGDDLTRAIAGWREATDDNVLGIDIDGDDPK